MAGFPEPEVGLVISYSYLWKEEEERGQVEGPKGSALRHCSGYRSS